VVAVSVPPRSVSIALIALPVVSGCVFNLNDAYGRDSVCRASSAVVPTCMFDFQASRTRYPRLMLRPLLVRLLPKMVT
jgi:hypothetical protein